MSYVFSSSTLPVGYAIVGSDLIVAADAPVFNGVITIVLTDGATTVSQTISINGSDSTVVPLVQQIISLNSNTGYTTTFEAVAIAVTKAISNTGFNDSFSLIPIASFISAMGFTDSFIAGAVTVSTTIARGGQSRTIGAIRLVPALGAAISRGGQSRTIGSIGVLAIAIQQGSSLTVAAGNSTTLSAQVTIGGSPAGVNQAVTWSIVAGTYSGYGSISSAGVLTVTNGVYQATGAVFVVRATSVSNPTLTTSINIYAIDKFTGIQVTPSASIVAGGGVITINSLLQGIGSDLNASHVSLISVTVSQTGASTVTLSGNSATYTAIGTAGTININATFFYAAGNYQVQGSATVQNTGSSTTLTSYPGLTRVPAYTITKTGNFLYSASLDYATLNDDNGTTGAAIGNGAGIAIVVDLGSPLAVKKVVFAGGSLANNWQNTIAAYLNDGFLEYSSDNTTWTTYVTIAGVTDTLGEYREYNLNITARYWRVRRDSYCVMSAFVFYT